MERRVPTGSASNGGVARSQCFDEQKRVKPAGGWPVQLTCRASGLRRWCRPTDFVFAAYVAAAVAQLPAEALGSTVSGVGASGRIKRAELS